MRYRLSGFTLLELMIVIAILAIIVAIAIPNLVQARKHGNEANAIGGLKAIQTAEAIFCQGDREQDGNIDFGMLSELQNTQIVDVVLGTGTKSGYIFQASYSVTSSEYLWFGVANPVLPTFSGDRYFASNQAGDIFYTSSTSVSIDNNSCLLPNSGLT